MGLDRGRAIAAVASILVVGVHVAAKAGFQEGLEAFALRDYDVAEFEFARSSGADASFYLGVIQVGANGAKVPAGMNALLLAIKAGHPKAEELLAMTCQSAACGPRPARECAFFETPIERSACSVGRERLRRGQQQSQARQGALPRAPINVRGNTVIEAESVTRDGNILRYRTRLTISSPEMISVSEVGVDCIARTRIDYLITTYFGGREIRTPAGSPDMRSVFDGTRQAYELDTVCRLADSAAGAATVFPELAQATPSAPPSHAPAPAPAPVSPARPVPNHDASTARPTQAIKSTGSGFFVTPAGDFVTNHHVIDGCERVEVVVNGKKVVVEVLARDEEVDLALLKIRGTSAAIALAADPPELGEAVVVLGYPLSSVLGDDLRVTTGVVSSLSGIGSDRRYMQISASVQPGNSGGPVLDPRGAVSAMVVAKLAARFKAENVNFAIRAPLIRSFLEINGVRSRGGAPSAKVLPTIAEAVRRGAPAVAQVLCYGR